MTDGTRRWSLKEGRQMRWDQQSPTLSAWGLLWLLLQSVGKRNESKAISLPWGERDWRLERPRPSTREEGVVLERAPKLCIGVTLSPWLKTEQYKHRVKLMRLSTEKLPEILILSLSSQSLVDLYAHKGQVLYVIHFCSFLSYVALLTIVYV